MAYKSFEVEDPLQSSLRGYTLQNPSVAYIPEEKVFIRKTNPKKVALISGGGSGHEPAHAGFIGEGMLAAAVCGDIFASPSTKQILNAIRLVNKESSGVLLIVKNYTGDVLHFGLSAERARALGINCEVMIVSDDTAVGRAKGGMVGRRALAGTSLVHKITGAFAETYSEKYGLEGTTKVANIVNNALVTIGASLDHCKVPGRKFESNLKDTQMELGMGLHNEPGVKILEPIPSTEDLILNHMLPSLLDSTDNDRYFVDFKKNDEVIVLINNLGGVSNFIISAIAAKTNDFLQEKYNIKPVQILAGTVFTAFNGNGFSITLLNASKVTKELKANFTEIDSVMDLFNAPTNATGWNFTKVDTPAPIIDNELLHTEVKISNAGSYDFESFSKWMKAGAEQIVKSEPNITSLDTIVGDGDCGYTLVSGTSAIAKSLTNLDKNSLSTAISQLSDIVEDSMGGTSGGLYSILLSGFSRGLVKTCKDANTPVTADIFAQSLEIALETLYKYTKARVGSSTMIDALEPFIHEFSKTKDFKKAVEAAEAGAKSTGTFEAKFGRASYVGDSTNVQDPGAVGLVEFLKGILNVY